MEEERPSLSPTASPTPNEASNNPTARKNIKNPFLLPSFRPMAEEEAEDEEEGATEAAYEGGLRRKASALTLKKVAHAVRQQRKLSSFLKDVVNQSDDHSLARGFVASKQASGADVEQERLSFNVNAFKSHVQSCGTLPPEVKKILGKLSWNRTEEEVDKVLQIVKRMKGFRRYPMYVKRELAKVLYYDKYEKGRVIIKQGHIGISFYFIASGSVIVQRIEEDRVTGAKHNQIVGEMTEGDSFGELALLHDIRRTATIACKERSEFLRVDKQDFNEVLRMSHQIEYERKLVMLQSQPVFSDWAPSEIKQTVTHTKLREFQHNTVILGDIPRSEEYIYFIRTGSCKVVREMELWRRSLPSGKSRLTLPPLKPNGNNIKPSEGKIERKFLTIRVLREGEYFGVGEDLTKTYIISVGKVHCVLVHLLMFNKRDRGRLIDNLREDLIQTFPTTQQVFNSYIEGVKWRKYKKKCIDEVLSRMKSKPHATTFEDVPLVVRRENSYYNDK